MTPGRCRALCLALQISTYAAAEDRGGPSAHGPRRRGTPAVASRGSVHGCGAPAASGVNERAAVRSNTAHAPAHFTPALIDRCPSGSLSLSLPFSLALASFSRLASLSFSLSLSLLPPRPFFAYVFTRTASPSMSEETSAGDQREHPEPRTAAVRERDGGARGVVIS